MTNYKEDELVLEIISEIRQRLQIIRENLADALAAINESNQRIKQLNEQGRQEDDKSN